MESPESPEGEQTDPSGPQDDERPARPARAWYVFSDDLPDGEILMPIFTQHGTFMAVRRGHMTQELMDELNASLRHLIGTGLWQPGDEGKPPEREE
ncbi:hypothetical protein AB0912_00130 [Streptomyces sp. NPDC007084]|uniref:hypothetical protein n=1 Tax=Streptomyces sp. NPDC007084 TaxID=3154313 RepID=UPI00345439A4